VTGVAIVGEFVQLVLLDLPNMTGSDFFGFDFRAWDQTSGTNGGTVNTAGAIGGAGTFSVNVDSVRVTINSANDAS
jgi:hypothetical protein